MSSLHSRIPYRKPPNQCPVCETYQEHRRQFRFIQNYKQNSDQWSLFECPFCFVQFWHPFSYPGRKYYENVDFYYERDAIGVGSLNAQQKFFLKQYRPRPFEAVRLLDIGCGSGEFIHEVKKRLGWEVWGIDINRNVIDTVKKKYHIEHVYAIPFEMLPNDARFSDFDIVTAFEVIEHIGNPAQFIAVARRILKKRGVLVISTPNRRRLIGRHTISDFPPVHLTRWDIKSLPRALSGRGFDTQQINEVEFSLSFFTYNLFAPGNFFNPLSFRIGKKIIRYALGNGNKNDLSDTAFPAHRRLSRRTLFLIAAIQWIAKCKQLALGISFGLPLWTYTLCVKPKRSCLVAFFKNNDA